MRKVIVFEHISLDGVIQGPGGPDEDPSGGFAHGGWIAPYDDDETIGAALKKVDGHAVRSAVSKEIALRLGERSSKVVADIDQALLRIKEGSYGICARCSQPIDERRLEALPTARYDAACQAIIESANGDDDLPTL